MCNHNENIVSGKFLCFVSERTTSVTASRKFNKTVIEEHTFPFAHVNFWLLPTTLKAACFHSATVGRALHGCSKTKPRFHVRLIYKSGAIDLNYAPLFAHRLKLLRVFWLGYYTEVFRFGQPPAHQWWKTAWGISSNKLIDGTVFHISPAELN